MRKQRKPKPSTLSSAAIEDIAAILLRAIRRGEAFVVARPKQKHGGKSAPRKRGEHR